MAPAKENGIGWGVNGMGVYTHNFGGVKHFSRDGLSMMGISVS
jgi:hypothetical protein